MTERRRSTRNLFRPLRYRRPQGSSTSAFLLDVSPLTVVDADVPVAALLLQLHTPPPPATAPLLDGRLLDAVAAEGSPYARVTQTGDTSILFHPLRDVGLFATSPALGFKSPRTE